MDSFFYLVIFAGAIAGASTGLLGVYIVGMRMPFIGTCISHAAMVGTIFALLLGLNPTVGAIAASMIVGVGQYLEASQVWFCIIVPSQKASTLSITFRTRSTVDSMGNRSLSF